MHHIIDPASGEPARKCGAPSASRQAIAPMPTSPRRRRSCAAHEHRHGLPDLACRHALSVATARLRRSAPGPQRAREHDRLSRTSTVGLASEPAEPPRGTGPSTDWYLTRATGAVALILLTLALALGVVDVGRWSSERWPRFVVDALHRNVSLLALAFLCLHMITAVLDSFAPISLVDAVIPFTGTYRPFWLGLGAISFDLMLARDHHQPAAPAHRPFGAGGPPTGSPMPAGRSPCCTASAPAATSKARWMLALTVACLMVVLAAVLVRIAAGWPRPLARTRRGARRTAGIFTLGLLLWLPGGPLGKEWARRSGTPPALLGHSSHAPRRRRR